ncbi:MAG: NAD(P)-dependent malic enzyme [Steroidobacteraceae bacterium]
MKVPEILQVETSQLPGSLASVLNVIAAMHLVLEHVTTVRREQGRTLWEITLTIDESDQQRLLERLAALASARFVGWSDRVFEHHRGGKIEMRSRVAISTQQILRDIYVPGVARVCLAIRKDPRKAREYTYVSRAVAVVSDGSSIPGVGHVGARASLPVMEGRAALLSSLVGLSGVPVLVESTSVEHFVDTVRAIAPSFGAILLANVSSPRCFEIERKLRAQLDMPVLLDDEHGTAVVVLAALINAARIARIELATTDVGLIGLGSAGLGVARLLRTHGVGRMLGTDVRHEAMGRLAELRGQGATLEQVMSRARIVIATTGVGGLIPHELIKDHQIILALSQPDPEIESVAALEAGAAIAVDGKSINNVLAFPGLFAGALRAGAADIDERMLLAAARAIAEAAPQGQLVPDPLNPALHEAVAAAVASAAIAEPAASLTGTEGAAGAAHDVP